MSTSGVDNGYVHLRGARRVSSFPKRQVKSLGGRIFFHFYLANTCFSSSANLQF